MAALYLVLSAGLEFQHFLLRTTHVAHNLSRHLGLRSLGDAREFLRVVFPVGAHGHHVEGHFPADLPFQPFHAHSLPRLNPVLLSPATNHRVHATSQLKWQTTIIRVPAR